MRLSRFVPISTATFMGHMRDYKEINKLPQLVCDTLRIKMNCDINEPELRKLVLEDINRGDVPYFTKRGEQIYYGMSDIVVAKIKE